ncbi:MAG: class I SAM-dependent methyltransferase [Bacteroidetes bacterium]|nr:class I SAM-dependent methyltransferase [Bacteroidota bacterium]
MGSYQFKEHDEEGLHTLEAISLAHHFNAWMFEQVQPFMKGRILEIGSGIGNISQYFIDANADIIMSDVREEYCNALSQKFPKNQILLLDLVHPHFDNVYSHLLGSFDSCFAMNVIEHIEDDHLAMKNLVSLLKVGGKVLILVPAGPLLYNDIDRGLFHFRRYTSKTIDHLFQSAPLLMEKKWMFNALGIPAWFFGGKIMKKKEVDGKQMNLYDKLIPIARFLDWISFRKIGLSIIALATKR